MKKLRHALYAILNSSDVDSADYRIADYLIRNIYSIANFGIQDVADACFVSKSTVSRFCRRIGFADFNAVVQSIRNVQMRDYKRFDEYLDLGPQEMTDAFLDQTIDCMLKVREYATPEVLSSLAELLFSYDRIGIFGQMQSHSVALNFQYELASLGKYASCFSMMPEQEEFILGSGDDTLVVIVSSGGKYFQDFSSHFNYISKQRPYLVLITNNRRLTRCVPYDRVYVVPCTNNTASRPLSLQLFANLAVMHFSKLLETRKVETPPGVMHDAYA